MEQYIVTGMSCAACQARVEKAVGKLPGVTNCSVSLLTNSMGVEGEVRSEDIIRAVENAGYGARLKEEGTAKPAAGGGSLSAKIALEEEALQDKETPVLKRRLAWSAVFLLLLMYFSMGVHMWGWPVPSFMKGNHVAMGMLQMLLSGILMVINQRFFVSGFKSLFHGAPNMDTLIALGASAAFLYSTVMLFAMSAAQVNGGSEAAMPYMNEFYFESAGMILTLITVGKMLEAYSKGKTTNALKSLMKLAPKTARVIRGEEEVEIPADEVMVGDFFLVRPGESIPVDGVIEEGHAAINEAALTGESIPVDKETGDAVTAATLNTSGFLKCRATRVGEDTTLSKIISMVSDAAATKAPVAKLADTISGYFVPAVIAIAALTIVIWLLLGKGTGFALARGISVLVVSCPCALGLATPVAIMVGNGVGAKNGILFKTAEALQETGNTEVIALDKTGTITEGEPKVTDILPAKGVTEEELLRLSAALEAKSEHPLAKAVRAYAEENGIPVAQVDDFEALPGNGLTAAMTDPATGTSWKLSGGNLRFMREQAAVEEALVKEGERLSASGRTPLYFAKDDVCLGIIAVADTLRDDSTQAIAELRKLGLSVVMLTGDNANTAAAIGKEAGVEEVISDVLPDGKESVIRDLQARGKTAMVGDGINDAPALTRADTGIAIGAGTDVAVEAGDVVLMKNTLRDVPAAIRLSRHTYKNILENLFWALIYNTLLIPLAAGVYAHWGYTMNPMWGAAAMSLSSFFVVTNALRLNFLNIYDGKNDRPQKRFFKKRKKDGTESATMNRTHQPESTGETTMEKTMNIEGMMCAHCEATVKKALEEIAGVKSADVSHEKGCAVVHLDADVDDAVLKEAVEAKDYKVKDIA